MRYETQTISVGENMGPVDWSHEIAREMPDTWRDAEKNPDGFLYNGRTILCLCMYDGWPYWQPRPAVQFIGPLNRAEWNFFDSYGVRGDSIKPRRPAENSLSNRPGHTAEDGRLRDQANPNQQADQ